MDIIAATADYEHWLGQQTRLIPDDLARKHRRMAGDRFLFFRGAYYRWLQLWPQTCPELLDAPQVLAVGDLHVGNFGTWRDADGRLAWGVNDFDEAAHLPYTFDLIRLAASAQLAVRISHLRSGLRTICSELLAGYRKWLTSGGRPFVLEEKNLKLRALALQADREPVRFWRQLREKGEQHPARPDAELTSVLSRDLPEAGLDCVYFHRLAGMGSLGKWRVVLLAKWAGGWIAREAKALVPPANAWPASGGPASASQLKLIASKAVRCPDPTYRTDGAWLVRRLAPHCNRIEAKQLRRLSDETCLLQSMGREVANVHLGTASHPDALLADLDRRPRDWLRDAVQRMLATVQEDWKRWRITWRQHRHSAAMF